MTEDEMSNEQSIEEKEHGVTRLRTKDTATKATFLLQS